jgi:hypothetical protein
MVSKSFVIIIGLASATLIASAQKLVIGEGTVSFFSHAAIEDISALNKKPSGIFNPETNDIAFSIPIAEFKFDKSLMQEHFNEKYMESDKFPKSTFQGKIDGYSRSGEGLQNAIATGKLMVHGVSREVEIPGTLENIQGKVLMRSKFIVKLADHNIEIPQLMWQNVAEQVEVTLDFTLKSQ